MINLPGQCLTGGSLLVKETKYVIPLSIRYCKCATWRGKAQPASNPSTTHEKFGGFVDGILIWKENIASYV